MELESLKTFVYKQKTLKDHLEREIDVLSLKLEGLQEERQDYNTAKEFIAKVAREVQEKVKGVIENLVTRSIVTIFPELGDTKFIVELKQDKNEVSFFLLKDGKETPILDFVGEGLTDVISFSLRICVLLLSKKKRVLILDEPFRFLDRKRHEYASELIKSLSSELGIQFIIVTHSDQLIEGGDKVFTVENVNGISFVRQSCPPLLSPAAGPGEP